MSTSAEQWRNTGLWCPVAYVRSPTAVGHQELKAMTRHEVGRIAQRAQLVHLSAQRRNVPALVRLFEMHLKTVRYRLRR
jgi:hypothetical protein